MSESAARVPGVEPGEVMAGDLRTEEPRHRASAATTEPKLARYRMTVIFKAEDDGEAEIAEEKANDKLASFNYPVIDSRLEKLL